MNEKEDENMDGKQERLVEIYKLQAQLTNSVSNRRTTTNRFYIVVMSGLILIFSTLIELTLPSLFFLCFTVLMGFGLYKFPNKLYLLFLIYPVSLAAMLCYGLHKWVKIEKSFNRKD